MSKKKKSSPDTIPTDESYRLQMKHRAVDFDGIDLTDELTREQRCLLVIGENDAIHAHYIVEGKKVLSACLPLLGKTLVSVSVSNPARNKAVFAVAMGLFD